MAELAVIGPGALGSLFAARLFRGGVQTTLIDYNPERADLLAREGILVEEKERSWRAHPQVSTVIPPSTSLILILTKAYSTDDLDLPGDIPILTLQNGLGNAERLAERYDPARILAGTTTEAVTWLAPGHIRHVAPGKTVFGSWSGCAAEPAYELFVKAGFDTTLSPNPRQALWNKLILNAAMNPLSALLNLRNGALAETPESRQLLHALATEAASVAQCESYTIADDMPSLVEKACEASSDNISSMLQDIRNHKKTEIEAISGEVLARAEKFGITVPYTRLVYHLVRALESL